nr:MAG TPA: hypothetical protein [Caudoviricetes sp.]
MNNIPILPRLVVTYSGYDLSAIRSMHVIWPR